MNKKLDEIREIEKMAMLILDGEIKYSKGVFDMSEFSCTSEVHLNKLAGAKALYLAGYRDAKNMPRVMEYIDRVRENTAKEILQMIRREPITFNLYKEIAAKYGVEIEE